MIKVMEFLAGVPAVRQTEMIEVQAANFHPCPPNQVTSVGSGTRSRKYRNSFDMWGVMHYFGQEGKGEQVSFTKNIMHYVREEMCYYNIQDPTSGRMLVPIASAIIMLLMAHSLLEAASGNGSKAVNRCLFKMAGTDADGKPLRVRDCFEIDEKTWTVTKVKNQPLYNQFFGTTRCQRAIKELMLDELVTWHSVRAFAVTKMDDDVEVSIGSAVKMQGRRGKACLENGSYTRNSTKSTVQISKLMAAPLAPVADGSPTPSIAPVPLAHVGEQGDPMDLDEGDGTLKALLKRVNKQEAEIALNGNIVKNLCAQGSRAKE
jgi:hypothetical protein